MSSIQRIDVTPRASRAVIYNGVVYLAGAVAEDFGLSIKGQTEQALAMIDRYLSAAGTDKQHLLTAQIWLKNIARDFASMNEVYDAWTAPGASPTRATAQCEIGHPEALIEIVVTAAAKDWDSSQTPECSSLEVDNDGG